MQVRKSLKIRGRRKEKEKLPSGITADYSAEFFAHLDIDRSQLGVSSDGGSVEMDRGFEEITASAVLLDKSSSIGSNRSQSSFVSYTNTNNFGESAESSPHSSVHAAKVSDFFVFFFSKCNVLGVFFLFLRNSETFKDYFFHQDKISQNSIFLRFP